MSKASEQQMLREHGTRAFELKPGALVGAAMSDLRLLERKRAKEAPGAAPYAFHRDHVRPANSARDNMSRALSDRERGLSSAKQNTTLIYSNEDLLRAALALAPDSAEVGNGNAH